MILNEHKTKIWVAIIAGLAAIIVAIIQLYPRGKESINNGAINYSFTGTIVDESSNESIVNAKIFIIGRNEQDLSEGNGNFNIHLKDPIETIRVRVEKDNYITYDKSYDLPVSNVIIGLTHKK